jgi:hypothetical protein
MVILISSTKIRPRPLAESFIERKGEEGDRAECG